MQITTGLTRGGKEWVPYYVTEINSTKCIGCGRCFKACGRSVLDLEELTSEDDTQTQIMIIADPDDCIGCSACSRVCTKKSITCEPVG